MAALFIMLSLSIIEIVAPCFRWLSLILMLLYVGNQTLLIFGSMMKFKVLYLIMYTAMCVIMGATFDHLLNYSYLIYQGYNRKELYSVE